MRIFIALLFSISAHAMTCQVLEADGVPASGKTLNEARTAAWKACISRKVGQREQMRGPATEDQIMEDAEACLNARVTCK